ncbi:MAG: septal ring lytic transglycosylase RlpA family protein [Hyphomicrobium sp.]
MRANIVRVALALGAAAVPFMSAGDAEAKTPGKTYCYKRTCHRVLSLPEMQKLVGRDTTFNTSYYDDCRRDRFNPCGLTSSGEAFRANAADNAASPIYPNGTVLLIRNPDNGRSAVVRVNNSGPYWGKRKLDVSRATADALGFRKRGVANLNVRVVSAPSAADARYKKNRRYATVAGPIGAFASLDSAAQSVGGVMIAAAPTSAQTPAHALAAAATAAAPAVSPMLPVVQLASADFVPGSVTLAAAQQEALSPAEGLRDAARRTFGVEPTLRRIVPSSLTADALHLRIRTAL